MGKYCAYTIIDTDTNERFVWTDWETREEADAELYNLVNFVYGDEFTLAAAGIGENGMLHQLDPGWE